MTNHPSASPDNSESPAMMLLRTRGTRFPQTRQRVAVKPITYSHRLQRMALSHAQNIGRCRRLID
jgi:hypothetical protein